VSTSCSRYEQSALDRRVLKALADDPRISISELAEKAACDRQTARTHVRNLIQSKIVLNFGGIPNLTHLGFVTYYLLVRLTQDAPEKILRKPFLQLRNIFYAGKMIGDYDMILYLNARSPQELNQSIEPIKAELGRYIIHYDLLVQDQVHYWRQYTEGLFRTQA
jgi:DNA-binding Lrp family transcriptional regulator